jgi:hypothetical protein
MSECTCGDIDDDGFHLQFCPIYMQGRIAELEANERAQEVFDASTNKLIAVQSERIAELEQEKGLLQIAYDNKVTLLTSCEQALQDRDTTIAALRKRVAKQSYLIELAWSLTGSLWPQSETTKELQRAISEYRRYTPQEQKP